MSNPFTKDSSADYLFKFHMYIYILYKNYTYKYILLYIL